MALTFDDGPHPTLTPEILSILREYGVPATFFVIGVNAEQYPELVEKEFGAGHEIASHTYSHGSMKSMSEEKLLAEMRKEAELLAPLCDGFRQSSSVRREGFVPTVSGLPLPKWAIL